MNSVSTSRRSALTDPVLPKNSADLENGSSRGFPIIVVEHPAQFIAAADAAHLGEARRRLPGRGRSFPRRPPRTRT